MIENATPLLALDIVVIDTETTGLDVANDRVVQIALVPVHEGMVAETETWESMVDPGRPIPPANSAIHGLTDEKVAGAPNFAAVSLNLHERMQNAVIVGHNIEFDIAMLRREYALTDVDFDPPRTLDTARLARLVLPAMPNYGLDTIATRFGITITERHAALSDAIATASIYLALIPMLREQSIRTLAEAERACAINVVETSSNSPFPDTSPDAKQHAAIGTVQDTYPFQKRVRDVMSAPPLTIKSTASAAVAARLLSEKKTSSVFVCDKTGAPVGIVTERDLMRALFHKLDGAKQPVTAIMGAPLEHIDPDRFLYQALARMRRLGVRHLGVMEGNGDLVGALASGDLLRHRSEQAVMLTSAIEQAKDHYQLSAAWSRLPAVAKALRDEAIGGRDLAALMSEQLAAITEQAAIIAEHRMAADGHGPAPIPYCVLLLGSGGRGESLLAPDQDNAIIYADGDPKADRWFAEMAQHMADILDAIGVPYCTGGVMAKNAEWRGSVQQWRKRIDGWVRRTNSENMLTVEIFYDFRLVHGACDLVQKIETYAFERAQQSPGFTKQLASIVTDIAHPFTIFGNITTKERRADLKLIGLLPIVSAARALSLRKGITARSSKDRFAAVGAQDMMNADDLAATQEAHEIILGHIIDQQLEDIQNGIPPSNKVLIARLSRRERRALKVALKTVTALKLVVGDVSIW